MPLGPATRSIETPFCFLDETGSINSANDRYFAVGLLKVGDPCDVQREVARLRDRHSFYGELKWNQIDRREYGLEKAVLDVFFDTPGATFAAFIADKQKHDVIERFGSHWKAYEALARQLLRGNIGRNEVVTVLADEYQTPRTERFEQNIRDEINEGFDRLAVSGVSRMRSTGHDCLQLVDLLLGAFAYEYRVASGSHRPAAGKSAILAHFKQRCGAGGGSLVGGRRTTKVNLAVYRRSRVPSATRQARSVSVGLR